MIRIDYSHRSFGGDIADRGAFRLAEHLSAPENLAWGVET
jgi:hypothetical protein